MNWRKLRESEALRSVLERRAFFVDLIREFFIKSGFLEVETPYLQKFPNLDANVSPIKTEDGFFLHTSPEYSMKKLLAAGFDRIFQLCKVFRKERKDTLHLKEFLMLEWYRKGKDYMWLVNFSMTLLTWLSSRMRVKEVSFRGRKAHLGRYEIFSFEEAFKKHFGVSIADVYDTPSIVELAQGLGVPYDSVDWENTFNLIYLNVFEPELARKECVVFLVDYPSKMAAMAKIKEDKPYLCQRVEMMICGVEIMNGYSELTDPVEQRTRLTTEALKKFGMADPYVDEDFLDAIAVMGECAGAALGVDRLFMLFEGASSLEEVVFHG